MRMLLVLELLLILLIGCRSKSSSRKPAVDPFKAWVKCEKHVFPKELLPPGFNGDLGFDSPSYVSYGKMKCILIVSHGSGDKWWFRIDLDTQKWDLLTKYDDWPLTRSYPNMRPHSQDKDWLEFSLKREELKAQYKADLELLVDPLLKHEQQLYSSFPVRWISDPDPNGPEVGQGPPFHPNEAQYFDYKAKAHYESWTERWRGGWFGGENSHRKQEAFVGTWTFTFKGKPIFEDDEEQMPGYTYVTKDFRTVFYFRRGPEREFYIMDLTDLWKEADHATAMDRPTSKP